MNEKPVVIIDTREQTPLPFANLPTEAGTLYSGDYSVKDSETLFSIERKTVKDLCSSVTRGRDRFEHELHRLRGFQFARLLTVAGCSMTTGKGASGRRCGPLRPSAASRL